MLGLPNQRLPQLFVVSLLSFIATLGFHGSLDGWAFLGPAALGASIGLATGLVARHYRLYVGEAVALSALVFTIGGGLATLGSYPAFFGGLVDGWAHLLSSAPPAELTSELRVLPYVTAWAATLIGGELSRRAARPVLPIIGPAAAIVTTALVAAESPRIVLVQGVGLATGALVLALLHQWLVVDPLSGEASRGTRSRRVSAIAMTATIAAAAPLLGPWLPLAGANTRFDLRDHQERPWDPLAEPSPLVTLKASLKEGRSQDEVFRVTSSTPLTRFTTAILASYNGTVWAVADESPTAPAEFEPVDRHLPSATAGTPVSYRLEFAEPTLWIPVAGRATQADTDAELRFNRSTGTLAAPARVKAGDIVELVSVPLEEPATIDLIGADVPVMEGNEIELVPPQLRDLAGDLFEGVDAGPARALALADRFTQQGFYDHGVAVRPGHNLARLDEFLADPDRVVGYAEQYAAAAGVLSQLAGLPTRVAVGYEVPADRYVDQTAVVVADDLTAWIEVLTVEYGWVSIDVTPDRAREPQDETLGVTITDVAIPNPPPPPPPPPEDEVVARADSEEELAEEPDDDDEVESLSASVPTVALVGASAIGLPVLLLCLLGGIVALVKSRRRRRRRDGSTPNKISGAWQELLDGFAEAGVVAPTTTTPSEVVSSLLLAEPATVLVADDLRILAGHVDRATFHPVAPTEETADDAWLRCDAALDAMRSNRSRWQRLAMLTDPRPLIRHPKETTRP